MVFPKDPRLPYAVEHTGLNDAYFYDELLIIFLTCEMFEARSKNKNS